MTENLEVRGNDLGDLGSLGTPPFRGLPGVGPSAWFLSALAAIALVTGGSVLAAILVPDLRTILLREDGIIETGGVLFLAGVVLWAGVAMATRGVRPPLALAGLLGLAELMDETSFGARLFGFHPPALYGGGQLDGFHDLLILSYRWLSDIAPVLGWLLAGLMLAISAAAALLALRLAAGTKTAPWLAGHALIVLHLGLIGLAQVIDIATGSRAMSAVEEVLELDAAVVLAFYVAQQALATRPAMMPAR
jgi:hypothetical protein